MSMIALPAILQVMQAETLDWVQRQDVRDNWAYISAVDQLIFRGKIHGWWAPLAEIWLFGSDTRQAALEGLKGLVHSTDLTEVGVQLAQTPLYGIYGDLGLASHISTNRAPLAYPGVTADSNSLWAYLTSNELGSFQIIGSVGSGGTSSFMLRPSSGFKSGAWSVAAQSIFGNGIAAGFTGFTRTSHTSIEMIHRGVMESASPQALTMATHALTLFSAEAGAAESPQQANMLAVGGGGAAGMTGAIGLLFNEDMDEFQVTLGIYDDIQPPPEPTGPSAFGKRAYTQVIPINRHVHRQANFPVDNTFDTNYLFFPTTDCASYTWLGPTRNVAMAANPFAFVNGSKLITVTDVAHGAHANDLDVVHFINIVGDDANLAVTPKNYGTILNGIPLTEFANGFAIHSVPDVDHYVIQVSTTPAAATLSAGGAVMTEAMQKFTAYTSTFTVPREGTFWNWVWSSRADHPVTKPNSILPEFKRRPTPTVEIPYDPVDKIKCRPAFTSVQTAVGEMLVRTAWHCGYAEYNDPDDPLGQGYKDIAVAYGLDPAKIITWQRAWLDRETMFDVNLAGFAVCYDYVVLMPMKLMDVAPYFPSLGMMMDMEHDDNRDPIQWEVDLKRWCDICHAKGVKTGWLGHYFDPLKAPGNGFTPGPNGNSPRIVNYPNLDLFNIISANGTTPSDKIAHLEAQLDYVRDADGNVPIEKCLLSVTLGVGTGQITLADCERIGAWALEQGIINIHIRRAVSPEGGPIELFRQQQMIRYLPELSATQPLNPSETVTAWVNDLIAEGGSVNFARQAALTAFVTALDSATIWERFDFIYIFAAENLGQALKCLKRRVNATRQGSPLPTFTADQGIAFDGVQNYVNAVFSLADATAMLQDDMLLMSADHTSAATNGVSAGVHSDLVVQNISLAPKLPDGRVGGQVNSGAFYTLNLDSSKLTYIQRRGDVGTFGVDGVELATFAPDVGVALPDASLYIGAANNGGFPADLRASTIAAVFGGGSLTQTEQAIVALAWRDLLATFSGGTYWILVDGTWDDLGVWTDSALLSDDWILSTTNWDDVATWSDLATWVD